MSKELKVPGVGRVAVKNPLYREKAGYGTGRVDVMGTGAPIGQLTAQVLRDAEYYIDGKRVHATDLRNYTAEEQARKVYIEGTGYFVKAGDVMGFWGRFWGNIRKNDTVLDFGTGLVTNVGVMAMAADWQYANPSAAQNNTLDLANWHISGTGATAAAATDITLQTISANGGQTPVAGTQSSIIAANSQKYQTVATINYTGTESVTEWGLITQSTVSATTGSPLTAVSTSLATATGTPFTASTTTVPGQQLHIIRTTTTASYALVLSNTTSALTIPGWFKVADGTSGTTPGSTEAYTLYPILWDHKVFSTISVVNGDSIQYTYTLTIASGG